MVCVQEAAARKERLAKTEEERERIELQRQIERARQAEGAARPQEPVYTELKKEDGAEIVHAVLPKVALEAPMLVKPVYVAPLAANEKTVQRRVVSQFPAALCPVFPRQESAGAAGNQGVEPASERREHQAGCHRERRHRARHPRLAGRRGKCARRVGREAQADGHRGDHGTECGMR